MDVLHGVLGLCDMGGISMIYWLLSVFLGFLVWTTLPSYDPTGAQLQDSTLSQRATLQSSVASEVSNRYATRILLPALANGLGLGGQLYASANTQIMSNGFNTLEGRVGMPDGKAVAGTVLGGAAQQAGQVIASDAQKLPVKQVLVNRGQSIAVIFMSAVKESDKETNTPTDSAPTGVRLQPAGTFTPASHP